MPSALEVAFGFLVFTFICLLLFICFAIKRTHLCPHVEDEKQIDLAGMLFQDHKGQLGHLMALFPLGSLGHKFQSKQVSQPKPEGGEGDNNRFTFLGKENTLFFSYGREVINFKFIKKKKKEEDET